MELALRNYTQVKACAVDPQGKVGIAVPNGGDILEAIYFVVPEELWPRVRFAALVIQHGVDLDVIDTSRMTFLSSSAEAVVAQAKFLGSDNMNFPISLRCFGEQMVTGLLFDGPVDPNVNVKVALQYLRLHEPQRRDMISRTCDVPYSMEVVSRGTPNYLVFRSGLMALARCYSVDDAPELPYGVYLPMQPPCFDLPIMTQETLLQAQQEFHKWVPVEHACTVRKGNIHDEDW